MDQSIATTSTGPVHFLNLEYFFRLIYEAWLHLNGVSGGNYASFLSNLWVLVTAAAYILALVFLGVLIYSTISLNNTSEAEEPLYETLKEDEAEKEVEHSRWAHVQELSESGSESDWRQAIIEADIMLDDLLTEMGYEGDTLGEKLKQVDPTRFKTLRDAWDAHMVRNSIAHQGSNFQLTNQIAYRTISKYRNVFEEFRFI